MSFLIEYQVIASAISIRAISMSLRAFLGSVDIISSYAPLVELAIAEGMNNVLEHAYEGRVAGEMRIVIHVENMRLTVSIFDRGAEPDREWISAIPPLPEIANDSPGADNLSCEGRGRFIMDSLMDTLDYQRVGNENCLKMTKAL